MLVCSAGPMLKTNTLLTSTHSTNTAKSFLGPSTGMHVLDRSLRLVKKKKKKASNQGSMFGTLDLKSSGCVLPVVHRKKEKKKEKKKHKKGGMQNITDYNCNNPIQFLCKMLIGKLNYKTHLCNCSIHCISELFFSFSFFFQYCFQSVGSMLVFYDQYFVLYCITKWKKQ